MFQLIRSQASQGNQPPLAWYFMRAFLDSAQGWVHHLGGTLEISIRRMSGRDNRPDSGDETLGEQGEQEPSQNRWQIRNGIRLSRHRTRAEDFK